MSYRALVTIINQAADGSYLHVADFKLGLDEDFKNGEQLAELLGSKRSRLAAYEEAMLTPALSLCGFSGNGRTEWVNTYADQEWLVKFQAKDGYTRVEITGNDAGGEMIFFRSTAYAD